MSDIAKETPRALRCIISMIGRTNAGKSSLINAICEQDVAIVSETKGTTTDAVAKPYELLPLGAVTLYDTAGIDDESELGALRIKATLKVLYRTDIAVLVCGNDGIGDIEKDMITRFNDMKIPFIIAFNKNDIKNTSQKDIDFCNKNNISYVEVSAANGLNINKLKQAIIDIAPEEMKTDTLLAGDLFNKGDTVVMVVPLDLSAPKGRLILPQVQVLREILDTGAVAIAAKENDLTQTLDNLKQKPTLIISDSQVIMKVAPLVPEDIKLTTFSILFARNKGDLATFVNGANAIDNLKDGDKILIAEACSHHIQSDDIGKVKIPNWLKKYTGKDLIFEFSQGGDFPDNLEDYALVVHCGACMLNQVEMGCRMRECVRRNVPITNYGVAISKTQGVLERVIKIFNL